MIRLDGVSVMPAVKSPEFRRHALDLVAQGKPVARVAKDLGISKSCLRRWIEQDAVNDGRKEGLSGFVAPQGRFLRSLLFGCPIAPGGPVPLKCVILSARCS